MLVGVYEKYMLEGEVRLFYVDGYVWVVNVGEYNVIYLTVSAYVAWYSCSTIAIR